MIADYAVFAAPDKLCYSPVEAEEDVRGDSRGKDEGEGGWWRKFDAT
jgi:hypothetical protein